jgi:D-alanyl-D-alanine dipeptidase
MPNNFWVPALSWQKTIFLSLLFLGSVGQAQTSNKYSCDKKDTKAIETAIKKYLNSHSAISAKDVTILSKKCVSPYASAIVHPIKPITDDAVIYLQNIRNHWGVIAMGTSFDEKFLANIPKALKK